MYTKIMNFPFQIKSIEDTGVFSGYGSVFGNVDAGHDMVIAGAFEKSLTTHKQRETLPGMFYGHSSKNECGEWLEMSEDSYGLKVKGKLWIDGPHPDHDALKAYRGMKKSKGKMGLSIGYDIPEGGAEFVRAENYWRLKEIELWEVSVVPFPMNDLARVETVKSGDRVVQLIEKNIRLLQSIS